MVRSKSPITTDTTSPKDKNLNGHFYEDSGPTNEVADAITKSSLYINAYNLLSQDPDPMWLTRLVAIPSGLQMRDAGQFEFESGRKYQADLASVINEGFTQIKNLLAEYQEYKNTLPITQVQQASDAGFNLAITGSGIESSSISPVESVSPDVGASSVSSGSEIFSNVAGGILSLTSAGTNAMSAVVKGFIDLRNLGNETRRVDELIRQGQFNRGEAFDLELQKYGLSKDVYTHGVNQAMSSIRDHLVSEGFINVPQFADWSAFSKWWNEYGINEASHFNKGKRAKRQLYSDAESIYFTRLNSALFDVNEEGQWSASDAFQNIVDDMVKYKIDAWQFDFRYQRAKKRFDYLMQLSLDPKRLAEAYNDKSQYEAELAKYRSQVESYESQREEMKVQRLLKWIRESENSPSARALVAKALEDINPSELAYIDAYGAREIIDFLNQGNINPAPASANFGGIGVSQKR